MTSLIGEQLVGYCAASETSDYRVWRSGRWATIGSVEVRWSAIRWSAARLPGSRQVGSVDQAGEEPSWRGLAGAPVSCRRKRVARKLLPKGRVWRGVADNMGEA